MLRGGFDVGVLLAHACAGWSLAMAFLVEGVGWNLGGDAYLAVIRGELCPLGLWVLMDLWAKVLFVKIPIHMMLRWRVVECSTRAESEQTTGERSMRSSYKDHCPRARFRCTILHQIKVDAEVSSYCPSSPFPMPLDRVVQLAVW